MWWIAITVAKISPNHLICKYIYELFMIWFRPNKFTEFEWTWSLKIFGWILDHNCNICGFFYNFFHYWCIYFDLVAFSIVVAFNRFPERGTIHTVAFHRLSLVGRGNNLGGFSQYDRDEYFCQSWILKNQQLNNILSRICCINLSIFWTAYFLVVYGIY